MNPLIEKAIGTDKYSSQVEQLLLFPDSEFHGTDYDSGPALPLDLHNLAALDGLAPKLATYRFVKQVGHKSGVTFIDNSTVHFASRAIRQESFVTPNQILDLSTLINEYVFADRLVRLSSSPTTGTAVAELHQWSAKNFGIVDLDRSPTFDEVLRSIRLSADEWADDFRSATYEDTEGLQWLRKAWEALTSDADSTELSDGDMIDTTPSDWLGSNHPSNVGLYDQMIAFESGPMNVDFIKRSNWRSLFNLSVSQVLEVPYASSLSRSPLLAFVRHRGRRLDTVIPLPGDSVARSLDELRSQSAARWNSRSAGIQLPVFLAYLVRKVDRRDQLPEAIAELRSDLTPLRMRRDELSAALNGPASKKADQEIASLHAAFEDDANRWADAAEATAVLGGAALLTLLGAGAGPPVWLMMALSSGVAGIGMRDTLGRIHERYSRRDLAIIQNIGDTCHRLLESEEHVDRVLGAGAYAAIQQRSEALPKLDLW